MTLSWPFKDPQEVADYNIDWSARLGADTIIASVWSIVAGSGLTINSNEFSDTQTKVWLSGGTVGVHYQLLNHVTTMGGRQYEQTVKLSIKQK